MKHYKVPIPPHLIEEGFPIEWITVTDEGSVIIHFGTPVILNQLMLDDRAVINLTDGLALLIGTGQTVEICTKLARSTPDQIKERDRVQVELLAEASALVSAVEQISSSSSSKIERLVARMKKQFNKR